MAKDVKRPGGMFLEGIWVSALAIPIQLHYFLFTISPHFINVKTLIFFKLNMSNFDGYYGNFNIIISSFKNFISAVNYSSLK